jgi:small subunit ribosomal protein S13
MLSIRIKNSPSLFKSDLYNFSLTYGIVKIKLVKLCINGGININHKIIITKKKVGFNIKKILTHRIHSVALRLKIKKSLTFLWSIRAYRGFRHKFCLPGRGQRTKTNAKTKKKIKFFG